MYGNREPQGYKKLKIVGKGGCGIVFICKSLKDSREYAVKQISKKNKSDSAINDCKIEISVLMHLIGDSRSKGLEYIVKLIDYIEDNNDMWIVFEKGGKSLSSLMFKIKGEFHNSERIYSIKKGKFFQKLFSDDSNFKGFFQKLLEMINYLNCENQIVHCDIKPDNILYEYRNEDDNESYIDFKSLKLIDFGSAFKLGSPENFSSNTPEYMPPEITELLEKKASSKEIASFLMSLDKYPYVIDIWSLGVMILEILLSCPIWMSYKTKTYINGKVRFKITSLIRAS